MQSIISLLLTISIAYTYASDRIIEENVTESRRLWSGYVKSGSSNPNLISEECKKRYPDAEKVRPLRYSPDHPDPFINNTYRLWPGLMSNSDEKEGKVLYGFYEAMDIIWRNQNPPDCSKAKYMIVEKWYQGIGSELHVTGLALAYAIEQGRVLLHEYHDDREWRFYNPHCESLGIRNYDCYFEPLSRCTYEDFARAALNGNDAQLTKLTSAQLMDSVSWTSSEDEKLTQLVANTHGAVGKWKEIAAEIPGKSDIQCYFRWTKHLENHWKHAVSALYRE